MTGIFLSKFHHNVIFGHKYFYIDRVNSHAVRPVTHWFDQ